VTDTTPAPRWRRMLQTSLRAAATLLFAALVAGLVGLLLRDRVPMVAMLMYVPLVPLGATAIVWEIAARWRGLPRWPFALGTAGAIGAWTTTSVERFTNHATDHRAQVARLNVR